MKIENVNRIPSFSNNERDCVMTGPGAARKNYNPYTSADTATLPKENRVKTDDPFAKKNLTPVEAYRQARNEFLNYFKNTFAESPEFKAVFGKQTWNDIADTIIYDLELHRNKKSEEKFAGKNYVFTAEVAGMSGEVVLDKKTGKAVKISVDPT